MRPIDSIRPYEKNPRVNDRAVARSIELFGFKQPIVVDADGVIIVGHTRWKAAKKLGLTEVPVHVADNLTPEQAKAYRIADNKTNEIADWDMELLPIELGELKAMDIELLDLGFTSSELDRLLPATVGLTDPDDVPEAPAAPTSKRGDVWLLGDHRVMCGDSTSKDDVSSRLLGDRKPFMMVTDPPYGVEYDPEWRAEAGVNKNKEKMGKVQNDDRVDWTDAWRLFPGAVVYCWHDGRHASEVQKSIEAAGFIVRSQIIWAKDRMALSRGDYHWQHEPCWYAVRKGKTARRNDDRSQTTVWNIPARDDSGHGHGTQKPVECMERPIRNHGERGDTIYDPFLGSGTTVIACERTGRVCVGMELDEAYCDVIVQRWEQFTGRKAERQCSAM
jgi:DNA modification methylase